jgi:hypothetical protein
MDEVARLLTLLALAGGALTLLGGACVWFLDETRRIGRTLTQALGVTPQPMLAARGRGVGIGFDLASGRVAITWDRGGWQLTYGLESLVGVELILDRQVAARAFRGEARRGLDQLTDPRERVRLRFVFDDPAHPDFEMDLWRPEDEGRRGRLEPEAALHEANRWMARMEAILRRPTSRPTTPAATPPPIAARPPRREQQAPAAAPLFDDDSFDDDAFEDDTEDATR